MNVPIRQQPHEDGSSDQGTRQPAPDAPADLPPGADSGVQGEAADADRSPAQRAATADAEGAEATELSSTQVPQEPDEIPDEAGEAGDPEQGAVAGPPPLILTRTSLEQRARDHLAVIVPALREAGIEFWHVPHAFPPGRTRLATQATLSEVAAAVLPVLDEHWSINFWRPADKTWAPFTAETAPAELAAPGAWQFFTTVKDPRGKRRIAAVASVEVETWVRQSGDWVAPRPHLRGWRLPAGEPLLAPEQFRGQSLATLPELAVVDPEEFCEPIDLVFTWVDSRDPAYAQARAAWLSSPQTDDPYSAGQARTRSLEELRYALRSVDMYAPWVRRVFLVTDGQQPSWLDPAALTVVDHREILAGHGLLPTFNSHAIESALHRIPGLAEHYLYCNDDFFLGRRVSPGDFFTPSGLLKFQPSGEFLPAGPPAAQEAAPGVAGRRVRDLLERDFGRTITHKLRHTPYPQRRSLAAECEQRYGSQWAATAGHRWRDSSDIAPLQLVLWYALLTGRAVPQQAAYRYVELSEATTSRAITRLGKALKQVDMFCLNMRSEPQLEWEALEEAVSTLLGNLFPFTSRFERAEPTLQTLESPPQRTPQTPQVPLPGPPGDRL